MDRLPPIAASPRVAGPVAIGVIRPLVVLPERLVEGLSPAALRDVLVHECAHVRRRDHLVGLLQRLGEMIYWPHPLIHLLNRRLSRAREEVCDNFVLAQGDPCEFARTLLLLAESREGPCRPLGAIPLMSTRWKLEDRVAGLLDPRRNTMTRMSRRSLAALLVLLLGTGAALAGIRIGEPETEVLTHTQRRPSRSPPRHAAEGPWREIRGLVTDASGKRPVAEATVNLIRAWKSAGPVKTGRDGSFTLKAQGPMLLEEGLIASSEDGRLQGTAAFREPGDSQAAPEPTPIRLEPGRIVEVSVRDGKGTPVADATVEVSTLEYGSVVEGKTGPDGRATLRYPAGIKVEQVIAFKPGAGLDYFENYRSWPRRVETPLPESVSLVLNGSRSVQVKAVDARGNAIPGLLFYAGAIQKRGKLSSASPTGKSAMFRTLADGVARFDWVPADLSESMRLGVLSDRFHSARTSVKPGRGDVETVVRFARKVTLRGQVLRPDGTPAAGFLVEAGGVGKDMSDEYDRGYARTGGDGTFAIPVAPDHSLHGRRPRPGVGGTQPDEHRPATGGRGVRAAEAPPGQRHVDRRTAHPRAGQEAGGERVDLALGARRAAPPRLQTPSPREGREWLSRSVKTDDSGRYTFRVGPGEYRLRLPDGRSQELTVDTEEKLVQEDHLRAGHRAAPRHRGGARPDRGRERARRRRPGPGRWPSAAREYYHVRTDAQGRFELERQEAARCPCTPATPTAPAPGSP